MFSAADGNRISIDKEVVIRLGLNLQSDRTPQLKHVQVRCLVSQVQHNGASSMSSRLAV